MNNETQIVTRKKINNRLKRIEGQVRGVSSMVDRKENYIKIITQISAIKSALVSVENILIENQLKKVSKNFIDQNTAMDIMKIFNKRK